MMPQSNIMIDSQIDGRRRFKMTLEGTWAEAREFQGEGAEHDQKSTHLKDGIRDEEDRQSEQVLCIRDMQVRFHVVQLCRRGQGGIGLGDQYMRAKERGREGCIRTHLGIPDTRPVEKREQIQKRQPRNRARVHLAHQFPLVDARYAHIGVEHRLTWRLFQTVFDMGDVFLV